MRLVFDVDQGIGTRATMGVIVLQADETLEHEFAQIMNINGVALYHSRIPMDSDVRSDTLSRMERDLPMVTRLLPDSLEFDVIGFGCTSGATVIGSQNVARAIQSVFPSAQVSDPLAAIIAAGRGLKATRLGFISPYVPEVSGQMQRKLEKAGFEIAAFGSFEEGDDRVVARIAESSIVEAAERMAQSTPCDAIVISCTNLRTLRIVGEIESRTGVAVISSNLAMGWHMLRLCGITDPMPNYGRLFSQM